MPKSPQKTLFPQQLEKTLILASHNTGKIEELRNALAPLSWKLVGANELSLNIPDETGSTFHENAEIKAIAASQATNLIALADDSGLEVDALNGGPGLNTAHYGGWEHLLKDMADIPEGKRQARFVCVLALHTPHAPTQFFKGTCDGEITLTGTGSGGFGYDPVFRPSGETRTFAEMSKTEKQALSHRGKAIYMLLEALKTTSPWK